MRDSIGKAREGDVVTAIVLPDNFEVKRALIFDGHASANELASEVLRNVARWVSEGRFRMMPVRVIPHGLHGVPVGLKLLEENKIAASKCVYRIDETPRS